MIVELHLLLLNGVAILYLTRRTIRPVSRYAFPIHTNLQHKLSRSSTLCGYWYYSNHIYRRYDWLPDRLWYS